jgi:hypothetical protein
MLAVLLTTSFSVAASAQQASRLFDPAYAEAWLATVREDGRDHGLAAKAERIFRTSSGRYYVPDERDRLAIMALRGNRAVAAALAQAFEHRVEALLAERIARRPMRRDLAVLAALGPTDAARLIKLAEKAPDQSAAAHLPEAARAHRRIFFDGFRERTAREAIAIAQSEAPRILVAKAERKAPPKAHPSAGKLLALRQGLRDADASATVAARLNATAP